jgi:transmembrane sensor
VQLHGPHRSPTVEAGFRAWLAEHPENARQFERVTEAWDAGSTPVPGITRLQHWHPQATARRWAVAAVMLAVVLGLGGWCLNSFWLNPSYATGLGEQRIVRLSDGTRVTLNSETRISVAYRERERGVRVDRGEAYFEVAEDAARPFLVRAGVHRVQALGTAFIVRHEAERTAVTLVEGKIAVFRDGAEMLSTPDAPASVPSLTKEIILTPGERLTFVGEAKARIDEPRIEAVTAWRRSEVVLDKTELADAVAEMNRYDRTTLVIDDPKVARLRVSGIYHTGNSETFAVMIARLYGLDVVDQNGRISLRPAATTSSSK